MYCWTRIHRGDERLVHWEGERELSADQAGPMRRSLQQQHADTLLPYAKTDFLKGVMTYAHLDSAVKMRYHCTHGDIFKGT